MQEEYYTKFKCLLEYFVSHLEYKASGNSPRSVGYDTYIKPIKDFKHTGLGYEGHAIQTQVVQWDTYGDNLICVNVTASFGRYTTAQCYLNWEGTWLNVRPRWKNNSISNLYLSEEERASAEAILEMSILELGLFDNNKPNDKLKEFFDKFYKMIIMYNISISVGNYIPLLKSNHNLILTGAPGTGKTYLAKQLAQQMIFGEVKEKMNQDEEKQFNEQCGFVQFHPSYDYTDFVEGLRPKQDEAGNVGFERKDGVFKSFCKKAINSRMADGTDNFEEGWKRLVDYLNENQYIEIPLLTGARNICVEFNEYGTGLAERLYADGKSVGDGEWVRGHSKFFTKEQLYNIYRGNNGTPSGGHDNYRRAIVKYMIDNKWMKEYTHGHEKSESSKYVFIIDEINRGEISKIFGELFFSIDPGYRGEKGKVKTQYQNLIEEGDDFYDGFYVPENVYIIGTMNDIDRSVESMDFAFRRRFAFKEIAAEDSQGMLDSVEAWGKDENDNSLKPDDKIVGDIKEKMNNLNKAIWHKPIDGESDEDKSIEGLSSAYHIGASYFLKVTNYKNDDGSFDFDKLWEYHLEGLLFEYLRGTTEMAKKLKKLAEAYGYTKADKYE